MCLYLCEMHINPHMVMYNYALSSWAMERKVWHINWLKNNSLLKNSSDTQRKENVYHEQFSHENIQQRIFPNYGS